jgi:uncharacterized membrane protein YGL010W
MLCPPIDQGPLVANWLERHDGRLNFLLHMIGIPISITGFLLLPLVVPTLSLRGIGLALGLFVGGYVLQFLGHWLEGTDPGEIILVKRRLGYSYVEFPRRQTRPQGV